MFQETCRKLNINPDLNLLESVPILQAVGAIVPGRMRELQELQEAYYEPVVGFHEEASLIVNDVENIQTQELSIQSQDVENVET
jgi:hypothetical protein